jgi:hypothetical protein
MVPPVMAKGYTGVWITSNLRCINVVLFLLAILLTQESVRIDKDQIFSYRMTNREQI